MEEACKPDVTCSFHAGNCYHVPKFNQWQVDVIQHHQMIHLHSSDAPKDSVD
jgi:hypothetical protein